MPPRKTRAAPRAKPATSLAPQWRTWIVDNLLRGADPPQLVTALRANGVPAREARARVAEIAGSPALAVAQREQRRAQRYADVLRLIAESTRSGAHPAPIERRTTASPEEFFTRYYATNTPVVFTDLVTRWPAAERWTPAYLKSQYGDAEVQMTDGRAADPDYDMNRERHFAMTRLGDFVDRVVAAGETNDFYLIARNYNTARAELRPLLDDVDWSFGYLDEARAPRGSALWFGPAGTVTPLHHDTSNILFAQVYGRKKLVLASPAEAALLDGARAMYAACDPERLDAAKDPAHAAVHFREVVLAPGEALFIPVGWWHHVRALDVSISLALNNFARPNTFDWYMPGAR